MTKNTTNPEARPDLEQAKLELEKWRLQEDIALRTRQLEEDLKQRRDEFEFKKSESSRQAWSSPLLLAIIGVITTVLASIVQNYYQNRGNQALEQLKFGSNLQLEQQKFESSLIQKALESNSKGDAAQRFRGYLALNLIKDDRVKGLIQKYIDEPETIPLQPPSLSVNSRDDGFAGTDLFSGVERASAKLSLGSGTPETFTDLGTLLASLPADNSMVGVVGANTVRTLHEQRNIRVDGFLYAASREASNDFTLIVGRARQATPPIYFKAKVSGLPATTSPFFRQLSAARTEFTAFFKTNLPGFTYDFYDPPIPIKVEGSLFFNHVVVGRRSGPATLRDHMPTAWELRPISSIKFESSK